MDKVKVEFDIEDYVWLCEFISTLIKEGELSPYEAEDTAKLYNILYDATH